MKAWKQIALCLLVILAAIGGWYVYNEKSQKGEKPEAGAPIARGSASAGARAAPLVVVEQAGEETVNNRLTAIGSARAFRTVSIVPYSSGYLTHLAVQAGDVVKEGDVIAQLDNETEKIAVAKAQTALKDAETTLARIARLRQTNTASAVQEVTAELEVANARLALEDAQLALDRRTVRAPISGVVGIMPVNVGNYITSQTSIARIDDRSKVLIDIWVPERFAPHVKVGQALTAQSTAFPGVEYQGTINAVDNTLDGESRTLHVRAQIDNERDLLRAGMSFTVTLLFPGQRYPSVNPLAIQWDSDGSYIWRVEDGIASRVPARIVQRNSNNILLDGSIKPGDVIVTEGVQTVRDAAPVRILEEQGTALGEPSTNNREAERG